MKINKTNIDAAVGGVATTLPEGFVETTPVSSSDKFAGLPSFAGMAKKPVDTEPVPSVKCLPIPGAWLVSEDGTAIKRHAVTAVRVDRHAHGYVVKTLMTDLSVHSIQTCRQNATALAFQLALCQFIDTGEVAE